MAIKYSLLKSFPASPGIDSAADIPLTNNVIGDQLYVAETNRLYIWNGSGWYNIALINTAPTITNGANASYILATDGTPTVITLTATDPEGIPITWSYAVTSGSLGSTATITQADNVFTITPSTNTGDAGTFGITFTASDGVNTATSTTSITLGFVSAYWDETVLSVGTNSTNALANSTFIDRSTNALTVTPTGTPVQTAFHPYLDNWSVYLDGSGDAFGIATGSTGPGFAELLFDTSDFTVECWVNPSSVSGAKWIAGIWSYSLPTAQAWALYIDSGVYKFVVDPADTVINTSSSSAIAGVWTHIAVTRSGDTFRMFINGVLESTTTSAGYNMAEGVGQLLFGTVDNAPSDTSYSGYISNFHTVKGTALYTSNFDLPTENVTAVANSGLILFQSNRFVDNGPNSRTVGVFGNPRISSYNPFGQESEYVVGENKGSVYLDGNADYLTSATSAVFNFGTDPFTVSLWAYPEVVSDNDGLILIGSLHLHLYQGSWTLGTAGSGGSAITTAKINTWTHLVIERDGGNINLYIDGSLAGSVASTTLSASSIIVGYYFATNYAFQGYLSDIKVVNGTAVYGGNFTPPTAPTGNTNASYYLPMDNAGIFDKTGNHTLTPIGNASTSTTQTKYADTAMAFDGSGDYFVFNPGHTIAFGTGDFTVEAWVYMNNLHVFSVIDTRTTSSTNSWGLFRDVSNGGRIQWNYGSGNYYSTGTDKWSSVGVYQHIVYCRSNGTGYFFVDGELLGTVTDTNNYVSASAAAYIGSRYEGTGTIFLNGYIENLQILKGVAKYTANFTPPAAEQGRVYQAES